MEAFRLVWATETYFDFMVSMPDLMIWSMFLWVITGRYFFTGVDP
jgi:hypothetical protein